MKGMIRLCRCLGKNVPSEGNRKCKGPEVRIACKRDAKETNAPGEKEANGKIGTEDREVGGSQIM